MQPTVITIKQANILNPDGTFTRTFVVDFTVGTHGPFTVQLDGAAFTTDNVKKAMQEVADKVNAITKG